MHILVIYRANKHVPCSLIAELLALLVCPVVVTLTADIMFISNGEGRINISIACACVRACVRG